MTIYHVRSGFDIYDLSSGGSSVIDAIPIIVNVGRTLIRLFGNGTIGTSQGGILLPSATDVGSELRMICADPYSDHAVMYLPVGESIMLKGGNIITISAQLNGMTNAAELTMVKISTNQWLAW